MMSESAVPSIKHLLAQRTQLLLRTLILTDFFGPVLPPLGAMVQRTRLPKNIVQDALVSLELEGLINQQQGAYTRVYGTNPKKKQRIAIITHTNIFHNAYGVYHDFLIGIAEGLRRDDLQLTIAHELTSLESKIVAVEEMHRSGVSALVIMGRAEPEFRLDLAHRKIPAVICGNYTFDQSELTAVCSDNYGGMRRMVRHVIEQGHTDICYYTSDIPTHDGFCRRLSGYRETIQNANLLRREEMVFFDSHSPTSARKAADVFVALAHKPSVIVCGSDRDAYELISELHRSGVMVPRDVAITGFDNSLFYAISELALTTMDTQGRQMGQLAGFYLLQELNKAQMPLQIMVPTKLMERASVPLIS